MTRRCGVIFDMDGVLVDSAAPHEESWRVLAAELGHNVTSEQFTATFGRQNRDIIPLLFDVNDPDQITALSERKELVYRELVRDRVPLVRGAAALVRALHSTGVGLAIGSSGPRENIDLVVKALDACGLFHAIVSANDVTRGKPDPQVFLLAAERLGRAPADCVVIEDAPVGVTAARRAGCKPVAVLMHHPQEAFAEACRVYPTLGDIDAADILTLAGDSAG